MAERGNGRRRGRRAAQAQGRGGRRPGRRPHQPAGDRAEADDPGTGVRPAVGGGARPQAGHVQLQGAGPHRCDEARARAVGRRQQARPLVRGRPRPGQERNPGLPAQPHHRAGEDGRPGGQRHRAARRRRARVGQGVGRRAGPRPHRGAAGPGERRLRPAPLGAADHARQPRLGSGHVELRRRAVVRRLPRLVRHGRRGARAAGPARGGHQPAQGGSDMSTPPRMVTSAERLRRLLALVPYVVSRKAVGLADAAATFGMTERELIDDLNLAWCVELMAPEPYCPIDLSYEGGEIVVSQAESIGRPLRLAADEASALLVALRMLAEMPGDSSAVARLIAKIEEAAGAAAAASAQVAIQIESPNGGEVAAQVRDALADGRRVHLRHYVPGRDETTERDVDPMRLLVVEGRSYLEGWCRRAEGVRLFRLDRVLDLTVLDEPAAVPESAEPVDIDEGLFRPSPQDVSVVLELRPAGHWVAEYYPCESVDRHDDELRVTLRTPDTRWVRRLALRLGEDGRVIAPADLAAQVSADAAAALAQYASGIPGRTD